jgi:hypothetical protein
MSIKSKKIEHITFGEKSRCGCWILIPDSAPVDRAERFSPLSLASERALTAALSSIVSEGGEGEEGRRVERSEG